MLEQMRKGSRHPIVKGLFFLLAITFVVWGVGDVFRNNSGVGYIATVGKIGITEAELDNMVRGEVSKYQEIIGKTLSEEEIDKLGIKRYALGQLIRGKVTLMRVDDLGLVAGKKMIAKHLYENDAFFNEQGKFDKDRFKAVLQANGYSEDKYIKAIKQDAEVNTLLETMTNMSIAPEVVAGEIFMHRNETRIADLISLPSGSIIQVPEPSETDLVQFYKDNQDNFAVPEQRAITYLTFNIDKIKAGLKLSEEELKDEYQRSIQQYKTEENRNVEQYLFSTEQEANAAYEKISKGDVKGFSASQIELGNITKSSVPVEVKDVIFSLKQGEVSKPAKSSLGWHVFIVKSIESEKIKGFDEVKGDIEKELIANKASDEFSKFGNQVEDEFAAGKTMEDVATKFDLIVHKVPAVDSNGNGINGSKLSDFPDPTVLLPVVFNLDTGAHSALTLLSDNASYAIIRVDSITQKRTKALDEVKGVAIKLWKDQEKIKLLKAKATELAAKIKSGADVKSLVSNMRLKFSGAVNLKRPAEDATFDGKNGEPVLLARELFNLKKEGDVTGAYQNSIGDFVIARLKSVVKANPASDKNGYKNIQTQLEDAMREDIMSQYITYLQNKYPVSIKTDISNETR